MDATRFDELVKALSLSAARRGMVAGLFGGALISLLDSLETAARRHTGRRTHRDDDLSAEKRKKKKCKKCGPCKTCKKGKCKPKPDGASCSGGSCQRGACQPGDPAPPCTDESCPIPPGCSESVLDECTSALFEAWLAAAEPCQTDCEGGDGPACRACVEPILSDLMPGAEACVAESCGSTAAALSRHPSGPRVSRASTREWWPRSCDKPTCCHVSKRDCVDDASEALFECFSAALAGAIASGGAGGLVGLGICMAKLVYQMEKCQARYGCPDYKICIEGDICCDPSFCPNGRIECPIPGEPKACAPRCCPEDTKVCCNGTCCSSDNAKCCGTSDGCYDKNFDCSLVGG